MEGVSLCVLYGNLVRSGECLYLKSYNVIMYGGYFAQSLVFSLSIIVSRNRTVFGNHVILAPCLGSKQRQLQTNTREVPLEEDNAYQQMPNLSCLHFLVTPTPTILTLLPTYPQRTQGYARRCNEFHMTTA